MYQCACRICLGSSSITARGQPVVLLSRTTWYRHQKTENAVKATEVAANHSDVDGKAMGAASVGSNTQPIEFDDRERKTHNRYTIFLLFIFDTESRNRVYITDY